VVGVFAVRIEHRADEIVDALMACLNVGVTNRAVAIDIDEDAADQMLGSAAAVQVTAQQRSQCGDTAFNLP